jgi:predicted dehydrogenase
MKKEIRVALCGIGGYGEQYLEALFTDGAAHGARLVAAIDPFPERCQRLPELEAAGTPLFRSLEDFFAQGSCDLVVVCSPIHFHAEQVCAALDHGCHVLCEKPLCVTEEEAERMARAEKDSGKSVTIGYQWSFSPGIQQLKSDCLAGRFGRPVRLRTLVCWPRGKDYYARNRWAGALQDPQGRWVLDSPVSNATAHFLHNMLYVIGPSRVESATVAKVEAQLFRANPIPNYDTAALEITTDDGVALHYYVSHATETETGPDFIYEFERGTIVYDRTSEQLKAFGPDGEAIVYPSPDYTFRKLWHAVEQARGPIVPLCGISAAWAQARCVILAQKTEEIRTFPASVIKTRSTEASTRLFVPGLQEALGACFEGGSSKPLQDFWTEMQGAPAR